jgi:hypothetical protein
VMVMVMVMVVMMLLGLKNRAERMVHGVCPLDGLTPGNKGRDRMAVQGDERG